MTIDSRLRKTIKHSKTVISSPPFPSTAFILSRSRLTAYRIEVALEFKLYSFCLSFATFYLYDFRKDVDNRFDYFDKKFNDKIDAVDEKLTSEIKIQSAKIDALAKDHEEFKNETRESLQEIININRDVYNKTYLETKDHLLRHDLEIKELKAKLA